MKKYCASAKWWPMPAGEMTVASMLLMPDETYEEGARNAQQMLAVLRLYDDFLARHRIRPEFFCKYREKVALQRSLRTLHSLQGTVTRKYRRHAAPISEHRFTGEYPSNLSYRVYWVLICKRCGRKVMRLIFYLLKFLFFSNINVIPFKIVPLCSYTPMETFSHFW